MAGKKVLIKVSAGHRYVSSVKDGREYVSVSCQGRAYGSSYPCDCEDEVKSAIKSCKKLVRGEGDIPFVEDNRMTLDLFF